MADDHRTIGDLRKAAIVTDERIDAAVAAYLADPDAGPAEIGGGYAIHVPSAVKAHPQAREALADLEAKPAWRRTMVRTAVLLARPQPA